MNRPWRNPAPPPGWFRLKVGAGGLVTGFDTNADGTVVCRTDGFGAYIYNRTAPNPGNAGGTGVWQQLVTTSKMPSSFLNAVNPLNADGVYEIRIAPSNSSVLYLVYLGYVFVSTNQGATFIQSSLAQKNCLGNPAPPAVK